MAVVKKKATINPAPDGNTAAQLRQMVRHAVLAPSGYNSQPWLFRVLDDAVELLADRNRALPVTDPEGRELTISCGAALFHLRLAMRQFGMADKVILLPNSREPDLLARVTVLARTNRPNMSARCLPRYPSGARIGCRFDRAKCQRN